MKKFIACFICLISLLLSACSLPVPKPKSGIWYCEELRIAIDFSIELVNDESANTRLYQDDGTYQQAQFIFHVVGDNFDIDAMGNDYPPLYYGTFKYKKRKFIVTLKPENIQYTFIQINDYSDIVF